MERSTLINLFLVSLSIANPDLFDDFSKCSIEDSECITSQAQALLPVLTDGIPKLGTKKLDKMLLDPITVESDGLFYESTISEIEGLRNTTVDKIRINMRLHYMTIMFHTTLRGITDYKINGSVYAVPVYGSGKLIIVRNNVRINMIMYFNITKDSNGKDLMDLQAYRYGFDVKDGAVYDYHNMYNGDKERGERFNAFLNENWLLLSSNLAGFFFNKVVDNIFEVLKIFMKHKPLEDMALL